MQTPTKSPLVWGGLLPAAMAAATMIFGLTSVLGPELVDEFSFSKARLGWVLSIFSITSAFLSPVAGAIADRIGARNAMLGIFVSGAISFTLFSQAIGFKSLVGAVMVMTAAQALGNPATNKMIATEFEPGQRGLVTGIKQSGVQVGTFFAGAAFPTIAQNYGWRLVPMLVAGFFALCTLYAWFTLPVAEAKHLTAATDKANEDALSKGEVSVNAALPKSVPLLTVYALLMGLGGSPLFTFLPLYAVEQLKFTSAVAGFAVAVSGLVGVIARIGVAVVADKTGKFYPLLIGLSLTAVAAGAATIGAASGGYPLLIVSAALSGIGVASWNAVAMLAVINDAGAALSGKATGWVLSGFLTGLAIAPPLFGYSVDQTGSYTLGFSVVIALFFTAAVVVTLATRISR